MNTNEYIKSRLDIQIDWYDKKSISNQTWYKRLRFSEFVFAALIPFLSGFVDAYWGIQIVIGIIGVIIATITASLGLYQFEQNWIEYRTTCESLRKEKYLFVTKTEPYNGSEAANLSMLVKRVESLVSKENTNWAQYITKFAEEKNQ